MSADEEKDKADNDFNGRTLLMALAVVEAAEGIRGELDDHQADEILGDGGLVIGEQCFECEVEWPCLHARLARALDAWKAAL